MLTVQIHKLNSGRVLQVDVILYAQLCKPVINMRKMVDGHIANEGAIDFICAHPPVHPTKENNCLSSNNERFAKARAVNLEFWNKHGWPSRYFLLLAAAFVVSRFISRIDLSTASKYCAIFSASRPFSSIVLAKRAAKTCACLSGIFFLTRNLTVF